MLNLCSFRTSNFYYELDKRDVLPTFVAQVVHCVDIKNNSFLCVSFEGVKGQKTTVYIDAFTQYLMEEFSSDSNDSSSDESNDEESTSAKTTKTSLLTQGKSNNRLIHKVTTLKR